MPAKQKDIVLEEQSTFTLKVQWLDEDCNKRDITGYGAAMEVKEERDPDASALLEGTVSNGVISLNTTDAVFNIGFGEDAINDMPESFKEDGGYYDLIVFPDQNPDAGTTRLLMGRVRYSRAVTVEP